MSPGRPASERVRSTRPSHPRGTAPFRTDTDKTSEARAGLRWRPRRISRAERSPPAAAGIPRRGARPPRRAPASHAGPRERRQERVGRSLHRAGRGIELANSASPGFNTPTTLSEFPPTIRVVGRLDLGAGQHLVAAGLGQPPRLQLSGTDARSRERQLDQLHPDFAFHAQSLVGAQIAHGEQQDLGDRARR